MKEYNKQSTRILTLAGLLIASAGTASETPSQSTTRYADQGELRDTSVLDALGEALQDEYHSHETYKQVLEKFGDVFPFVNIVQAESRHIERLSQLYRSRGLDVPKSQWTNLNVPTFSSVKEACTAGVEREIKNISIYERLLQLQLPSDIRLVFENLQRASRENHLPAFRRCIAM